MANIDLIIYELVKQVYNNEISAKEAAEYLHQTHNINKRSFVGWYIPTYRHMLLGQTLKGHIRYSLRKTFLQGIYEDYGRDGLNCALQSYLGTITYYETMGLSQTKDREIYEYYLSILNNKSGSGSINEELDEYDKPDNEGHRKAVFVNIYERSASARKEAISIHGTNCAICGFNFQHQYGNMGEGFIHIHHIIPISQIGKEYRVNPKTDLIPVCPNCHAMLHRRTDGRYLSIDELKNLVQQNKGKRE